MSGGPRNTTPLVSARLITGHGKYVGAYPCVRVSPAWLPPGYAGAWTLQQSVQTLLAREGVANEACRGGSGDNPATQVACGKRDRLDTKLQARGWCYGENATSGADSVWAPCGHPAQITSQTAQEPANTTAEPINHTAIGAGVGIGIAIVLMYFVPTIVAFRRKDRQRTAIFILNLFLGWTLIGWVGALVWAYIRSSAAPLSSAPSA